ncbi:MAG: hypothetical protein LIP00_09545, partial [Parabacteroides sp.]|nr:hypothetical protein [Parabacteroides sp.]
MGIDNQDEVFSFVYAVKEGSVEIPVAKCIDIETNAITISRQKVVEMFGGVVASFAPVTDKNVVFHG